MRVGSPMNWVVSPPPGFLVGGFSRVDLLQECAGG